MTNESIYIWGDGHRSHVNCCTKTGYDARPFDTIEQHDQHLIDAVEALPDGCTLIDGGDISMGGKNKVFINTNNYFKQIQKKRINLICLYGNNDNHIQHFLDNQMYDSTTIDGIMFYESYRWKYKGRNFFASHYPYEIWDGSDHGTIHTHFHSHHELPTSEKILRFCLSCNLFDCKPVLLDDIIGYADEKIKKYGDAVYVNRH